jgi:hypothetical protein
MIQKRILQFLAYKSLSKYKFYQETGLSNGFLDKEGAIGTDKCERIISVYPEINLEWLITGNGAMLKGNSNYLDSDTPINQLKETAERYTGKKTASDEVVQIPVYNDDPTLQKPIGLLTTAIFPGCDYAEKVTGDSMQPAILNQGIVVGKKIDKEGILFGEKYGIRTRYGLNTVRFILAGSKEKMIKLVATHPSIPDQEIDLADIILCFRVLYIINPA